MSSPEFRARLRRLRREEATAPPPVEGDRGPAADDGASAAVQPSAEESERGQGEAAPTELDPAADGGPTQQRAGVTGPTVRGPLPGWLRQRMDRDARPEPAGGSVDPPRDLAPIAFEGAASLAEARTTHFGGDHRHGDWRLDWVDAADPEVLGLVARDDGVAGLDPRRAVYLDIETTGLSGGAGTYPYLVALGRFEADGAFALWQGFMAGPEAERDLLRAVAERVADAGQMVTFFGKSFDRHRLEDKMRMHGVEAPFEAAVHLDLYHPCRRLYRDAFVDGRLQTMERELCGFTRVDDLPGSMAPAAWFDFVAGRPHRLEEVFQHNLDDVLSLVALTAHLGCSLDERRPDGAGLAGSELTRARGLATIHERARDWTAALHWVDRAIERLTRAEGAVLHPLREHRLWRAQLLDRLGDRAGALAAATALAEECEDDVAASAWALAAKLLEHHARDPAAALAACQRASRACTAHLVGGARRRLATEVDRRQVRLAQRLERS